MSISRRQLTSQLAGRFGYAEAVLFGRARSGLIALLDALGLQKDVPFVMPTNMCAVVLLAVLSRGVVVRLAGVSAQNGLVSDEAFVAAMTNAEKPGVVMPTYLYGFKQAYDKTMAYAKQHGWFVLENDTLATRLLTTDATHLPHGDAMLLSFGYAKSIEAGGGGALLTNDPRLTQELQRIANGYPPLDQVALTTETAYMLLQRQMRSSLGPNDGDTHWKGEALLIDRMPPSRFAFPERFAEPLALALASLDDKKAEKMKQLQMWTEVLSPFERWMLPPDAQCAMPWRVIRRVPEHRDQIVKALRSVGIDAGTNFPPLTDSFPKLLAGQGDNGSKQWGDEVFNLWLTPAYDRARMNSVFDIIDQVLTASDRDALPKLPVAALPKRQAELDAK